MKEQLARCSLIIASFSQLPKRSTRPNEINSSLATTIGGSQDSMPTQKPSQKFVSFITLPCPNIHTEVQFYRSVFELSEPVWYAADFACWKLEQLKLALLTIEAFTHETGLQPVLPGHTQPADAQTNNLQTHGCLLSHNATSQSEVGATIARAQAAQARFTIEASHTSWGGFRGFFCSPAGQLWEVCYNSSL